MIRQLGAVMDSVGCAEGHGNLAMDTAGIPVQGTMRAVPCSPKGRGRGAGTGAMGTPRPRPAVSGGLGSAQPSFLGSSSRCPPTSSVPGHLWDWLSLPTPSLVDQGTSWHQPSSLAGAHLLAPSTSPQGVFVGATRASCLLRQAGRLQHCPERPPGTQTLLWAQAKPLRCTTQHPPCSLPSQLGCGPADLSVCFCRPLAPGTPTWFH